MDNFGSGQFFLRKCWERISECTDKQVHQVINLSIISFYLQFHILSGAVPGVPKSMSHHIFKTSRYTSSCSSKSPEYHYAVVSTSFMGWIPEVCIRAKLISAQTHTHTHTHTHSVCGDGRYLIKHWHYHDITMALPWIPN